MLHQLKDVIKGLLRWQHSRGSSDLESNAREMPVEQGKALAHRFQVIESCVGLLGCLCVSYAVWAPYWLDGQGLWTMVNSTSSDSEWAGHSIVKALEFEQVFAVLAFIMSVCSGALCLLFALCWTHDTMHTYSNTRSLLMAGTAHYPTTLLLIILTLTGFFFILSWSFFTHEHLAEIREDIGRLGSSYWLGAVGWATLLAVEPVIFVVEQIMVPDLLSYMMESVGLSSEGYDTIFVGQRSTQKQKQRYDPTLGRYVSVR
ncbi:hypothetical protein ACEWY4_010933 [Coilia grayii]|uniref:Uncharacterized protein n=1 Tax=Coilia grayii TaxID=363190 RepID=A0ABD1K3B8_9TELE